VAAVSAAAASDEATFNPSFEAMLTPVLTTWGQIHEPGLATILRIKTQNGSSTNYLNSVACFLVLLKSRIAYIIVDSIK
jgi:hypothetical protein